MLTNLIISTKDILDKMSKFIVSCLKSRNLLFYKIIFLHLEAYHGLDQRYVIQGFGFDQPNFFDDTDRKVEKFLVDSIVNFIKTK